MIDLSFELGVPAHELAHRLPERDYWLYHQYALKRSLPSRRRELYLAQISLVFAKVTGNTDSVLSDFLFDPVEEIVIDDPEDAKGYFGFNPRIKE